MSYNYRPATVDDLDEVVNIIHLLIEEHILNYPDEFKLESKEKSNSIWLEYINDSFRFYHYLEVCERNNKIIGLLAGKMVMKEDISYRIDKKMFFLEYIAVNPDYRNKKIATELGNNLNKWANSNNIDKIIAEVWEFNNSCKGLYEYNDYKLNRFGIDKKIN